MRYITTFLILLNTTLLLAQENTARKDLADFTTPFVMRNLYSGNAIGFNFPVTEESFDWRLIDLSAQKLYEPVSAGFGLSLIQIAQSKNPNLCLALDRSNNRLTQKNCKEDLSSKKYDTVFTIIPSSTTAVQLKAYSKGGVLCVNYDPSVSTRNPFIFRLCNLDRKKQIDLKELFVLIPSYKSSKVTNP
ncbi:hypothetical protein [Helicobacter pametensis]|uniref:hypothetical protein n=1 Tax=Helicobacter pametensis TaxID=95149 RepID=UPI00048091F1|nr:hypothetical protein [Helicobacter pametensis]